jgi:hypothetical protein
MNIAAGERTLNLLQYDFANFPHEKTTTTTTTIIIIIIIIITYHYYKVVPINQTISNFILSWTSSITTNINICTHNNINILK